APPDRQRRSGQGCHSLRRPCSLPTRAHDGLEDGRERPVKDRMEKLLGDPRANQSDLIRAFLNLRHDASLLGVKDLHIDGRKAAYGIASSRNWGARATLVHFQPLDPTGDDSVRIEPASELLKPGKAKHVRSLPSDLRCRFPNSGTRNQCDLLPGGLRQKTRK